MANTLAITLVLVGGFLISGIRIPRINLFTLFSKAAVAVDSIRVKKEDETASDYVHRINGTTKQNILVRSLNEMRQVYTTIGQQDRYQSALRTSLLAGLAGWCVGMLLMQNWMLSLVLGVGCYFIPMWMSQFLLYRYQQFVDDELETALSLITTSYIRSNDILGAVSENLEHIKPPVKDIFTGFYRTLTYVDANAPAAIEQMKTKADSNIFAQWCDTLILCQENHLLQAALPGIVAKFSNQKEQREANATTMMLPLQQTTGMICLVVCYIPLMWMFNRDWYDCLVHTTFGQLSVTCMAVAVFVALNKAIQISKPLTYQV